MKIKIIGTGLYLPPKIETSKETAVFIGKNENWIISKTGVVERRRSDIDVDKMGAIAASMALKDNSVPDLIINASGVPKQSIPDTSVFFSEGTRIK